MAQFLRAVILFALAVSVYGVARVSTVEELKRLARLPKIQLAPPLDFNRHAGFVIFPDTQALNTEAAKLQKELREETSSELQLRLGRIYDQLGNHSLALRFYTRAIDQLRRKAEIDPSDALLQSRLGEALALTGQFLEALPHLQKAVTLEPENSECWLAFGIYHQEQAWRALASDPSIYAGAAFLEALNDFIAGAGEGVDIERTERFLDSARDSFEKATRFGPDNPKAYARRGTFRAFEAAVRAAIQSVQNDAPLSRPLRMALITPEAIGDFQRAAELDSANVSRVSLAAFLPLFASIYGEHLDETALWQDFVPRLAPGHAAPVRSAITQLEALGEADNPETAAAAAEMLGCVKLLVFRDSPGAMKSFRAALALDPERERAWDLLTLELNRRAQFAELLEHCSQRVILSPSVRNYIFLAKACERTGDYTKAEWIVLTALASSPNDFHANLALANLLLKRPNHASFLGRVQDSITKAERHMGPSPTAQNHLDLALTKALFFALSDQPEKAREILKRAQRSAPAHPELTAALTAIGY